MFKLFGVLGWALLGLAVWMGDLDPHAFYDHLLNGRDPIEEQIKNPPDISGRGILMPEESETQKSVTNGSH